MIESLLEQTAPHVSAFARNMAFGRFDAGLMNLEYVNKILDGLPNGLADDDYDDGDDGVPAVDVDNMPGWEDYDSQIAAERGDAHD